MTLHGKSSISYGKMTSNWKMASYEAFLCLMACILGFKTRYGDAGGLKHKTSFPYSVVAHLCMYRRMSKRHANTSAILHVSCTRPYLSCACSFYIIVFIWCISI